MHSLGSHAHQLCVWGPSCTSSNLQGASVGALSITAGRVPRWVTASGFSGYDDVVSVERELEQGLPFQGRLKALTGILQDSGQGVYILDKQMLLPQSTPHMSQMGGNDYPVVAVRKKSSVLRMAAAIVTQLTKAPAVNVCVNNKAALLVALEALAIAEGITTREEGQSLASRPRPPSYSLRPSGDVVTTMTLLVNKTGTSTTDRSHERGPRTGVPSDGEVNASPGGVHKMEPIDGHKHLGSASPSARRRIPHTFVASAQAHSPARFYSPLTPADPRGTGPTPAAAFLPTHLLPPGLSYGRGQWKDFREPYDINRQLGTLGIAWKIAKALLKRGRVRLWVASAEGGSHAMKALIRARKWVLAKNVDFGVSVKCCTSEFDPVKQESALHQKTPNEVPDNSQEPLSGMKCDNLEGLNALKKDAVDLPQINNRRAMSRQSSWHEVASWRRIHGREGEGGIEQCGNQGSSGLSHSRPGEGHATAPTPPSSECEDSQPEAVMCLEVVLCRQSTFSKVSACRSVISRAASLSLREADIHVRKVPRQQYIPELTWELAGEVQPSRHHTPPSLFRRRAYQVWSFSEVFGQHVRYASGTLVESPEGTAKSALRRQQGASSPAGSQEKEAEASTLWGGDQDSAQCQGGQGQDHRPSPDPLPGPPSPPRQSLSQSGRFLSSPLHRPAMASLRKMAPATRRKGSNRDMGDEMADRASVRGASSQGVKTIDDPKQQMEGISSTADDQGVDPSNVVSWAQSGAGTITEEDPHPPAREPPGPQLEEVRPGGKTHVPREEGFVDRTHGASICNHWQ